MIDGEEWYSLADVCTRVKAERSYWLGQLGDHARQILVGSGSVEQAPWFISSEAVFRIAFAARGNANLADFKARCIDRLAAIEAIKRDAVRTVLALDGKSRKSDKAVSADEVREWKRMRDDEGLAFNQIQKRTGRSRALVRMYLNPETAPAWVKREVFGKNG